jgi:hypothetical protein
VRDETWPGQGLLQWLGAGRQRQQELRWREVQRVRLRRVRELEPRPPQVPERPLRLAGV